MGLRIAEKHQGSLWNRTILFLNSDTRILSKKFFYIIKKPISKLPIVGFTTLSNDNDIIDFLGAYVDYLSNPQDILLWSKNYLFSQQFA